MKKNGKTTTLAPPSAPVKAPKPNGKKRDASRATNAKAKGVRRQAIVSLPIRVAMGVVAVILLVVAGVLMANMTAIDTYNQATASLNASLEYAKKPNADQQQLKAQLDQTNAQFDEARRLGLLLTPSTKEVINVNSDISGKLTSSTARKIAKDDGNGSGKGTGGKANGQGSGSSTSGKGNNQGLTDEQRKQVEDTLKANQPNGPVNGDKKTPTKKDDSANVKPW
ncbi:DUF6466 family protein [Bifidobacterium sp. ESL0775]|uniref:DUF6466 family protein n=1 Tax=Bifidobacterium sp. ESL0775 TaxID=2983230 RepID=UPI0023F9B104|nr:DUF6466 family protein [Bifidobacterium sp. ESL0775]WEV69975.1 DUF6466 family protein [Bifidobacterium sp. ESL0775]